jgi:hypothetical protein
LQITLFVLTFELNVMKLHHLMSVIVVCIASAGCDSSPPPAKGGTAGTLKFGDQVTSDIVVTIHKSSGASFESIGFGTTQPDGTFVLYKPGAIEPLYLEPGDYCCTLESIGPPIRLPKEYQTPANSPMKVTWPSNTETLELSAPQKILAP